MKAHYFVYAILGGVILWQLGQSKSDIIESPQVQVQEEKSDAGAVRRLKMELLQEKETRRQADLRLQSKEAALKEAKRKNSAPTTKGNNTQMERPLQRTQL